MTENRRIAKNTKTSQTSAPGRALLALAFALLVPLAPAGAFAQDAHAGHAGHAASAGGPATSGSAPHHAEMHAQMQKMNTDMTSAPMTGDPDIDFAAMMIPHHQGAIDMARTQLKYGKDEKLRRMAEKIIQDQEKEIRELKERLAELQKESRGAVKEPRGN